MRELKFRGYAVDEMVHSQWLYGFGVQNTDYVDDTKECHLYTLNGVYEVEPDSIGQYTGIKDKNGQEIYEGDIYHMGDPRITYTVIWNDTGLIGKQNGSSSYAGLEHWKEKKEVIGNIYEHPHLLEGDSNV